MLPLGRPGLLGGEDKQGDDGAEDRTRPEDEGEAEGLPYRLDPEPESDSSTAPADTWSSKDTRLAS